MNAFASTSIFNVSTLALAALIVVMGLSLGMVFAWLVFDQRAQRMPEATRWNDLSQRLARLQADLDQKQEDLKQVLQRIAERDRFAAEVAVLTQQRDDLQTELNNLAPAREEIQQTLQEAAEVGAQAAQAREELAAANTELAERRAELDAVQRELGPERIEELRREKDALERDLTRVQDMLAPLRVEYETALNAIAEARQTTMRAEALRVELERLQAERDQYCEDSAERQQQLDTVRNELSDKLAGLRRADLERDTAAHELERMRVQHTQLQTQAAVLQELVETLQSQRIVLNLAESGPTDSDEKRHSMLEDLLVRPACLPDRMQSRVVARDEAEALDAVRDYLRRCGLTFHDRVLNAFHTALKTNDTAQITVLAGVSGTGKSLLPRRYAEAMGIRFLQVAVEPRWDSPQDLLGFYNYVEKKYRATELARLLAYMDPWNAFELTESIGGWRDHLTLVLLDEMNLARLEYYFSEFLSRLEARPPWDGQPVLVSCRDALMPIDIRGLDKVPGLFPAHNVLFVGTMNDDESTQSLSDKVLDRGNVLQFPAPSSFSAVLQSVGERRDWSGRAPHERDLSFASWREWVRPASALNAGQKKSLDEVIRKLAEIMKHFGRPFGYRLSQAMAHYAANYPHRGNTLEGVTVALADQVEFRILPKLRGVEIANYREPLDKLIALMRAELGDPKLADRLEETCGEQERSSGLFVWRGLER